MGSETLVVRLYKEFVMLFRDNYICVVCHYGPSSVDFHAQYGRPYKAGKSCSNCLDKDDTCDLSLCSNPNRNAALAPEASTVLNTQQTFKSKFYLFSSFQNN